MTANATTLTSSQNARRTERAGEHLNSFFAWKSQNFCNFSLLIKLKEVFWQRQQTPRQQQLKHQTKSQSGWKLLNSTVPRCGVDFKNRIFWGFETDMYGFPWSVLLQYKKREQDLIILKLFQKKNLFSWKTFWISLWRKFDQRTLCSDRWEFIRNFYQNLVNHIIKTLYWSTNENKSSVLTFILSSTAAHCIMKVDKTWDLVSVRLGEWDLSTDRDCRTDDPEFCSLPVVDNKIVEIIIHKDYRMNSKSQHFDIALLRLEKTVEFNDFVAPICLPLDSSLWEKD